MADWPSCHVCGLLIEMRYPVDRPGSKNQGYWSHLDNVAGDAADKDHAAVR
jgi:hypothetical protein